MPPRASLHQFVSDVHRACRSAVDAGPFCADQRTLLLATIEQLFDACDSRDWGQPLGLFYAIYRACGGARDSLALELARFSAFYIASADLFDDVEDEDLADKPHEEAGAAIATNSALTLLSLGLDALGKACELETRAARKLCYLRLFNRVSLIAVASQHLDLMGQRGARTRAEVESMHRGKTSSIALLCECAALAGGADDHQARRFYQMGEELAAMVQIIDDVRDLVAKERSGDLLAGKFTYPLACFYEQNLKREQERLTCLLAQDPIDLDQVRTLLAEAGAFDRCAEQVETHRSQIFSLLSESQVEGPHVRLLGEIVDHLSGALYEAEPRAHALPRTPDEFERSVHSNAAQFATTMRPFGFRGLPELLPWHLPFYLYDQDAERVFFSDLGRLAEEVVPFHQGLLGLSRDEAQRCIEDCIPFLIAHELTHAWRAQTGRLSDDAWYEEHVANRVALDYVRLHHENAAQAVLCAAQRLIQVNSSNLEWPRRVAAEASSRDRTKSDPTKSDPAKSDYDCSPEQAALVHAEMLIQMQGTPPRLSAAIERWLGNPTPLAAE